MASRFPCVAQGGDGSKGDTGQARADSPAASGDPATRGPFRYFRQGEKIMAGSRQRVVAILQNGQRASDQAGFVSLEWQGGPSISHSWPETACVRECFCTSGSGTYINRSTRFADIRLTHHATPETPRRKGRASASTDPRPRRKGPL